MLRIFALELITTRTKLKNLMFNSWTTKKSTFIRIVVTEFITKTCWFWCMNLLWFNRTNVSDFSPFTVITPDVLISICERSNEYYRKLGHYMDLKSWAFKTSVLLIKISTGFRCRKQWLSTKSNFTLVTLINSYWNTAILNFFMHYFVSAFRIST